MGSEHKDSIQVQGPIQKAAGVTLLVLNARTSFKCRDSFKRLGNSKPAHAVFVSFSSSLNDYNTKKAQYRSWLMLSFFVFFFW